MIDAVEGMTEQDARVAGYAWERGRALVLLVNKWDAVPATPDAATTLADAIDQPLSQPGRGAEALHLALQRARNVERIWDAIDEVAAHTAARLPTGKVNQRHRARRAAPRSRRW